MGRIKIDPAKFVPEQSGSRTVIDPAKFVPAVEGELRSPVAQVEPSATDNVGSALVAFADSPEAKGAAKGFTYGLNSRLAGLVDAVHVGAQEPELFLDAVKSHGPPHPTLQQMEDEARRSATSDFPAEARVMEAHKKFNAMVAAEPRSRLSNIYHDTTRDFLAKEEATRREHPNRFMAGEVSGAILAPTPKLGAVAAGEKGAAALASRLAAHGATGAGLGVAHAVGHGDENPELAGLLGGAGGVVGGTFGELAGWLGRRGAAKTANAVARQDEAVLKAALAAKKSAEGTLGGESGAGINALAKLRETLTSPHATDAMKAEAAEKLAGEGAANLERRALANNLKIFDSRLGRIEAAEEALGPVNEAMTPEALVKARDAALANPVKTAILPRFKKQLIDRYALPAALSLGGTAAGAVLGGDEHRSLGTGIGSGLGNAAALIAVLNGGKPSTAMEKMFASPKVQAYLGELMSGAGSKTAKLGAGVERGAAGAVGSGVKFSPEEEALIQRWIERQNP